MSAALLSSIAARRSFYALNKTLPISKEKITTIVKELVQEVPTSFNQQCNRAIVLFGAEHDKLWDIVADTLKPIVSEEQWKSTSGRLAGFKAGAASVLFFVDKTIVDQYAKNIPLYAERFPQWATHANGMLQFAVWTALEAEGLGANIQHYNPLIDAKVAETWGLPASWELHAHLVIGGREADAAPKTALPVEDKFKVFGA